MERQPRLLRPMLFLGILSIIVAAALWTANPGWKENLLAVLILGGAFLLGLLAVILDLVSFGREIQKMRNPPQK